MTANLIFASAFLFCLCGCLCLENIKQCLILPDRLGSVSNDGVAWFCGHPGLEHVLLNPSHGHLEAEDVTESPTGELYLSVGTVPSGEVQQDPWYPGHLSCGCTGDSMWREWKIEGGSLWFYRLMRMMHQSFPLYYHTQTHKHTLQSDAWFCNSFSGLFQHEWNAKSCM